MLPDGWEYTTFEDHIDLLSGFTFKSSGYTTDEKHTRLLRGDNIEPGALRWRDAKRWAESNCGILSKYHLNTGDFVIAMDRTWVSSGLKVAEVKSVDLPCLLVQRVSRIRTKKTLEQSLLRQYFSGHRFNQYVQAVQTKTAVPHISAQQIKNFPLLLPPVAEQKKIAEILSTWDKSISITEQLLINSQQQKKALMQNLLTGNKRLKGCIGNWKKVFLEEVAEITTGSSNRQDSNLNGPYTFFDRSEDIRSSDSYLFDCEAVIIPGEGQGFVPKHFSGKFDLHQRTYAVMQFKNCHGKYIYYAMSHFSNHLLSHAVGSTVKSLRLPMFQKMIMNMPPIDEQQKIISALSSADLEIEKLAQQLNFLKQEKNALMQQLLTGKRRVKINLENKQ
jgi:type I restriction enzyme S subunit